MEGVRTISTWMQFYAYDQFIFNFSLIYMKKFITNPNMIQPLWHLGYKIKQSFGYLCIILL